MPRPMTAAIQSEIAKAQTMPVLLVDLDFPSGAVRRTTHGYDLTFGGNTFTGNADLLDIGAIEETIELRAPSQRITLSGIPSGLLTTVRTDNFQGRPAKIWLGFLNASGSLIADSVKLFDGPMDTVEVLEGGEEARIVVTAENRFVDMHRARERRYTDEDQRQAFPDDKGLAYVESLEEKDIRWAGGLLPSVLNRNPNFGRFFGITISSIKAAFNFNTLTIREPAASRRLCLGETRVGGTIVFAHRTGFSTLHVIIAFCEGPVEAIGDIYFNDEVVPLDGSGNALNATYTATTISADASDDSFNDSAGGFPKLFKDDRITVTGFSNFANNSASRVGGFFLVDKATASKIQIRFGGLVDEGAGSSVIIEDLTSYAGFATIKKHLGETDQAADADLLVAAPDKWTANHRLRGVAYLYAKITMDEQVFADGLPNISAVIKGRIVRDARTNAWAHTANAALLLADYLGDRDSGLGDANITDDGLITEAADTTQDDGLIADPVTSTQDDGLITETVLNVKDADIITAADVCDEQVPLAGGGNENRYTINGQIDLSAPPAGVIQEMVSAMAGRLVYSAGEWKLSAGAFVTPTLSFDDDDLAGDIKVVYGRPRRDLVNAVRGTFASPSHIWRPTDYPAFVSSSRRAEDGGEPFWADVNRAQLTSAATCQRLGKVLVERSHKRAAATLPLKLMALEVLAGDTIKGTYSRLGWTNEEFEVENWRLTLDGDPPAIRIEVGIREADSTIFDWTSAEERQMPVPPEPDVQPLSLKIRLRLARAIMEDEVAESDKQKTFKLATLTDAATIDWDLNDAQVASVTLGGNRTLANPTNMKAGGTYVLTILQDATGSRTLAYGSAYRWQGGAAPTLSTAAGAADIITFLSDGVSMFGVIRQDFQ